MTRKDFELIARVLAAHFDGDPDADGQELIGAFADALASTNPRFDRERFLDASLGR